MSMDFTGVKAITIPEGSVRKITNQAGVVLWEKAGSSAYEMLESLELSSSVSIDFHIKLSSTSFISLDFAPLSVTSYANFLVASKSPEMWFRTEKEKLFAKIDWYNQSFATLVSGKRMKIKMDKQKVYLNNAQKVDMSGVSSFEANTTLKLGGLPMTFYSLRARYSDVLYWDYYPARRTSDGATGLLEKNTNTFIAIS